jgi:hypothetical protein
VSVCVVLNVGMVHCAFACLLFIVYAVAAATDGVVKSKKTFVSCLAMSQNGIYYLFIIVFAG